MLGAVVLALTALLPQYVSSILGMGYGSALAPLLNIISFPVKEVVPAVVISQLAGNSLPPILHHKVGNADFRIGGESMHIVL